MEDFVRNLECQNSRKNDLLYAYKMWLEYHGFNYAFQKYEVTNKIPYIPLEKYLDQIIACSSRKYAPLYQLIKESAFRLVEALRLTPMDFDLEKQICTLNKPAKRGLPRQIKISSQLTAMITPLIRKTQSNERIWKAKDETVRGLFRKVRKRVVRKLQEPIVMKITIKTFRHWKATMEYHKTKDILYVKKLLGHKNIKNTLIYTHLINFESDEWNSRVATTIKEACKLIDAGFDFVCDFEGKKIFRKRK